MVMGAVGGSGHAASGSSLDAEMPVVGEPAQGIRNGGIRRRSEAARVEDVPCDK